MIDMECIISVNMRRKSTWPNQTVTSGTLIAIIGHLTVIICALAGYARDNDGNCM